MATKTIHKTRPTAAAETDPGRPAVPATSAGEADAAAVATPEAAGADDGVGHLDVASLDLAPVAEPAVDDVAVNEPAAPSCAHAWERGRLDNVPTYHCPRCGAHKPR